MDKQSKSRSNRLQRKNSMKVTPVKVSTPVHPILPSISETSNEELSETSNESKQTSSTNSSNFHSSTGPTHAVSSWHMMIAPSSYDLKADELAIPSVATTSNQTTNQPTELLLCRNDFQRARMQRRVVGLAPVYGAIGLYQYVSQVRADLTWVETTSYHRQFGRVPYLEWDAYQAHRKQTAPIPYVSWALAAICTVLLAVSFHLNHWRLEPLSRNPSLGPSVETLLTMGALSSSKIIEDDEWYRLFTATVLHGGALHWLCNILAIVYLGPALERVHGSGTVGVVFVVAASAANLVSAVLSPLSISVGASGGLCAWYGLCLVDGLRHWSLLRAIATLEVTPFGFACTFGWIFLELFLLLLFGLLPWVDNFGHLGGLLFGVALGMVLLQPMDGRVLGVSSSPWRRHWVQCHVKIAIVCVTVAFLATHILWLHTAHHVGDLPCRNCRYMDCPPIPMFQTFCDPCHAMTEAYYKLGSSSDPVEIELHCPYGDVVYFTTPTLPSNRDAWMSACRAHCDI